MSVPTMKFIFCFASSPLPFLSSFLLSFHFHPLFLLFFQYFIPFNIYWNTAMCWTPWVWLGIQKCPLPVGGTHWPLAIHFNHEIWNFLVSFFFQHQSCPCSVSCSPHGHGWFMPKCWVHMVGFILSDITGNNK